MITQIIDTTERPFGTTRTARVHNYGLSTDTKPATAKNGDTFFEMNTKKEFMYDEDGTQWVEV